ncbi:MAG: NUDIX hydrolase [Ardenticatenaceae bacterium]|nr:NUDIX hydrolase [Ardenticatenaceae bacterium]
MDQPIVYTGPPRHRPFATSPIAIQAIVINNEEKFVLLNSLRRKQGWQVVSGGLEAGETILAGVLREVGEELGEGVRVRPLGIIHAETFHYDEQVRFMVSLYYLMVYEGGEIVPGDDMAGSEVRWWSLDELQEEGLRFHPSVKPWLMERAVGLYRLWRDEGERPLQPLLD